jgi:hypothetical protein
MIDSQELVVFPAGIGLVGVQLLFAAGQPFFQRSRVMFVARRVVNDFDEAVLIDVD